MELTLCSPEPVVTSLPAATRRFAPVFSVRAWMDAPRCPRMKPTAFEGMCTAATSASVDEATRPVIFFFFLDGGDDVVVDWTNKRSVS